MERIKSKKDPSERRAHMTCSHTHMFATCLITCLSIKRYQFTGRDMPLQKSSGVAILVSLQECGFFSLEPCIGKPTLESHRSKLGLRSTSSNAKTTETIYEMFISD